MTILYLIGDCALVFVVVCIASFVIACLLPNGSPASCDMGIVCLIAAVLIVVSWVVHEHTDYWAYRYERAIEQRWSVIASCQGIPEHLCRDRMELYRADSLEACGQYLKARLKFARIVRD